jgi:hypothetical protein
MWKAPSNPPANGERNLEKGNKDYAAAFTQGHLALPPSQKYAVRMYTSGDFCLATSNILLLQ